MLQAGYIYQSTTVEGVDLKLRVELIEIVLITRDYLRSVSEWEKRLYKIISDACCFPLHRELNKSPLLLLQGSNPGQYRLPK